MLFDYVWTDILDNPRLVKLSDLSAKLMVLMNEKGVSAIKDSTKTHVRRKLETEFGGLLHFEDLLGNNRVFIIPDNLSRNHVARDLIGLQLTQCKEKGSRPEEIRRVALELRKAIQSTGSEEMSWPPKASELNEDAIRIPEDVKLFLVTLLTGSSSYKPNDPYQEKDQRLVNSFGQDWIFAVTNGRQKPPKHILLPYAVKTLTNNVDVMRFLNRCGHGIAYSQIEEMNTALWTAPPFQITYGHTSAPRSPGIT